VANDLNEPTSPEEVEHAELNKAFREVFALAAGKRVLFWMLEQCAIYEDAFAGELTNATNYTLGRQSAGRRLIGKLDEIDPRMYPQLLKDVANIRDIDRAAAKSLAQKQEPEDDDL